MTFSRFCAATALALAFSAVSAFAQCGHSPLTGHWVAYNLKTNSLSRADIFAGCCTQAQGQQPVCSPPDSVHLFGKCSPGECDWGVQTGFFQNRPGNRMYLQINQGFVIRSIIVSRLRGDLLKINIVSQFKDNSHRPNRVDNDYFKPAP